MYILTQVQWSEEFNHFIAQCLMQAPEKRFLTTYVPKTH